MSTRFFIGKRIEGTHIGTRFATKEGPAFGFTPLRQNELDERVIQPGDLGYGLAMLKYWQSILDPREIIVDIYEEETAWETFSRSLIAGDGLHLSDNFVGIISQ